MNKKYYLGVILAAVLSVTNVYAASATLRFSGTTSFDKTTTIYLNVGGVSGLSGVCGFEGRLKYDSSKIELTSASAGSGFSLTQGGKIVAYRSNCVSSGSVVGLSFKNKALANNESTTVSFTDVNVSDESQAIASSNVSVALKHVEPAKTTNTTNSTNKTNTNTTKKTETKKTNNEAKKTNDTKQVTKSSNNSLKSIKLSVGNIDLKEGVLNYDVFVGSNVNTIEILAEASDSKATITGAGKYELKDELTEVKLVVKAEDDSTKTYTVRILKDAQVTTAVIEEKHSDVVSWVVLAIGTILAISGVVFFILDKKRSVKNK